MGILNSGSNRRFGFFDRLSLSERVAGERSGLRGGNTTRLIFSQERLLPRPPRSFRILSILLSGSQSRIARDAKSPRLIWNSTRTAILLDLPGRVFLLPVIHKTRWMAMD
jgi:hypothetical protein